MCEVSHEVSHQRKTHKAEREGDLLQGTDNSPHTRSHELDHYNHVTQHDVSSDVILNMTKQLRNLRNTKLAMLAEKPKTEMAKRQSAKMRRVGANAEARVLRKSPAHPIRTTVLRPQLQRMNVKT